MHMHFVRTTVHTAVGCDALSAPLTLTLPLPDTACVPRVLRASLLHVDACLCALRDWHGMGAKNCSACCVCCQPAAFADLADRSVRQARLPCASLWRTAS